jgi:hypothetical protein
MPTRKKLLYFGVIRNIGRIKVSSADDLASDPNMTVAANGNRVVTGAVTVAA